ncbi:type I-E CRISPR-associated endoribonuclease Cas2e [Leptospira ryugenii]
MSRLAIEIKAGVFVATINARVRDELWKRMTEEWRNPCIMIFSMNNEQGFEIRTFGDPEREVLDFDGLFLLARPSENRTSDDLSEVDDTKID